MHLRFDGTLGFPGGLIDKVDNSILYRGFLLYFHQGENIEEALNREVVEEMGEGNPPLVASDWMNSYYSVEDKILLHFYSKEVNWFIANFDELKSGFQVDEEEFFKIEKRGLSAKEYGEEILGLIRYSLIIERRPLLIDPYFSEFLSTPGTEMTGVCRSF